MVLCHPGLTYCDSVLESCYGVGKRGFLGHNVGTVSLEQGVRHRDLAESGIGAPPWRVSLTRSF